MGAAPLAPGPRPRRRSSAGSREPLLRRIARSPFRDKIHFAGYAAREAARELYRAAEAFAYPVARGGLRPAAARGDGLRDARRSRPTPRRSSRSAATAALCALPRGTPRRSPTRSSGRSTTRTCARAAARGRTRPRRRLPLGGRARGDGRRARRGRAEARGVSRVARPPRIGIDARKVADFGIGSYIRNLVEAIARAPGVASATSSGSTFRRAERDAAAGAAAHFEIVDEDSPGYSIAELTRFAWRLLPRPARPLPRHALRAAAAGPRPAPSSRSTTSSTCSTRSSCRTAPRYVYARVMIRRALRRADRIITVSYNSKRDLVDYFGIPPSRVGRHLQRRGRRASGRTSRRRARPRRAELLRPAAAVPALPRRREAAQERAQRRLRAFAEARRAGALPHALVLAGPMPKNRSRVEALISALDLDRQRPPDRRRARGGPARPLRRGGRLSLPHPLRRIRPARRRGDGLRRARADVVHVGAAGDRRRLRVPRRPDGRGRHRPRHRGPGDRLRAPGRSSQRLGLEARGRLLLGPRRGEDARVSMRRRCRARPAAREDRRRPRLVERHARRREGPRGDPAPGARAHHLHAVPRAGIGVRCDRAASRSASRI